MKGSRGRARCANAKDGRMDTHGQDDGSRGTETQQDRRWQLPSPLSRRAAVEAKSAAACAKKRASGRMQRPAELVPIPRDPLVRREGFGKLRKVAAFWKNPETFWSKFSGYLRESVSALT